MPRLGLFQGLVYLVNCDKHSLAGYYQKQGKHVSGVKRGIGAEQEDQIMLNVVGAQRLSDCDILTLFDNPRQNLTGVGVFSKAYDSYI